MKFQCPKCKKVFKRDMRSAICKYLYNKKTGEYTAYCCDDMPVKYRRVK